MGPLEMCKSIHSSLDSKKWEKVFKNGPSKIFEKYLKIFEKYSLKNLKWYSLFKQFLKVILGKLPQIVTWSKRHWSKY